MRKFEETNKKGGRRKVSQSKFVSLERTLQS